MAAIRLLTDARTVQSFIVRNLSPASTLKVDGSIGPMTLAAARISLGKLMTQSMFQTNTGFTIDTASDQRVMTAVEQHLLKSFLPKAEDIGKIDGLVGPRTQYALELYQNKIRDLPTPEHLSPTPYQAPKRWTALGQDFGTQKDIIKNFGQPATESNLMFVSTPYELVLDWQKETKVRRIRVHKKVANSVEIALARILEHYGEENIVRLGLNQFGGSYNPRKMRGSTTTWSTHAWGIAIDWDADRNGLRSNSTNAYFATKKECSAFLDIWESVGWISLGRVRNYDWMHVQAPRL